MSAIAPASGTIAGGTLVTITGTGRGAAGPTALSILGERLARGEIAIDDFHARKAALEEGRR